MRSMLVVGTALAALVALPGSSMAQDTTVIHRDSSPGVAVEHREGVVERKSVTTSGSTDCGSTTVHTENSAGESKTVHKEGCN